MSDKHFVVQGAECTCQFAGGGTDKLMLTSNSQDYINDGDGSKKAIASTKDILAPFEKKTFGSCSKMQGSSCVPNITKWENFYKKITLTNGGNVLTEESKATCAVAGTACISIKDHGQTAAVSSAHFEHVEVSTMAALNPMGEPVEKKKLDIPKVKSITAGDKTSGKKVPELTVRPNQELVFKVKDYINGTRADKGKVSWKIYKGKGFTTTLNNFQEIGPELTMKFDAPGEYRVMGYGTEKDDATCSIDVTVAINKLKAIVVAGKTLSRLEGGVTRVRKGMEIAVDTTYIVMPATDDEKKQVRMQVKDEAGNVIAAGDEGVPKICFTPQNAATYVVTATMGDQVITKEVVSEPNGVKRIMCTPRADFVRPGTDMTFSVAGGVYAGPMNDSEKEDVRWQLNGVDVGTGPELKLDGRQYLMRPRNYVVEAYVTSANAWDAKAGTASKIIQDDDYRFTVTDNYVEEIVIEGSPAVVAIGKEYTVIAHTKMPYDAAKDGPLRWEPGGMDRNGSLKAILASKKGKVNMKVSLNRSMVALDANADFATIEAWHFADKDMVYKGKAGWNENLKVVIKSPLAANTEVNVHILEADKVLSNNYISDLGKGTFNMDGLLVMDIKTDDLKKKLNKLSFEDEEYDMFFAILPAEGGIQFTGVKKVKCDGKEYIFPEKENNYRGKETGKYVYINDLNEVTGVGFFDSTGYPAYKTYKYGEQIKIRIQSRNLACKKLDIEIYENRYKQDDKLITTKTVEADATEVTELLLNTKELESGIKGLDDTYRAFYIIIKPKDWWNWTKFLYPEKVRDEDQHFVNYIYFFQHLKLSNANADAYNKLAGQYAPAVLGEAMEQEETEHNDCPRCIAPVTADQLKIIFPKADPAHLGEVADAYTKFMKEMGMDTCWDKAHFFAQAFGESGSQLVTNEPENFNYWKPRLLEIFSAFSGNAEGIEKAGLWARREEKGPAVPKETQVLIADWAYSADFDTGKTLGNKYPRDGSSFIGRGPIQITGRKAYEYANNFTKPKGVDIEQHPEEVCAKTWVAVLASMAFWKWKDINMVTRGSKNVEKVCRRIGNRVKWVNGQSSDAVKINAFKDYSSKAFTVDSCLYGFIPEGEINKFRIDADKYKVRQYMRNASSKKYQYDVYIEGKNVYTVALQANDINYLPFPWEGQNWGRYGTREEIGDNYASPQMVARLLGFFYSLPLNDIKYTLYFNDISASDNRNLDHKTHREGTDVDIRYPGSDNGGETLWREAKRKFEQGGGNFEKELKKVFTIARKWSFVKNYAYNSAYAPLAVYAEEHANHFHIGL